MNFTVKDPPEYNDKMRMLETSDPDHADVFNALFQQLLNNNAFLKKMADEAVKAMKEIVNNAVPDYKTSFNITGKSWGTVFKFKAPPQFANFVLSMGKAYNQETIECIRLQVGILNTSARRYRVEFDQLMNLTSENFIAQVRIVHNTETNDMELQILNNSDGTRTVYCKIQNYNSHTEIEMVGGNSTPSVESDEFFTYEIIPSANIIADRSIADGDGRNIAGTYATKERTRNYYVAHNLAELQALPTLKNGDLLALVGVNEPSYKLNIPFDMEITMQNSDIQIVGSTSAEELEVTLQNSIIRIDEAIHPCLKVKNMIQNSIITSQYAVDIMFVGGLMAGTIKGIANELNRITGSARIGQEGIVIEYGTCNLNVITPFASVPHAFKNCTGKVIDQNGMNLIETGESVPFYNVWTTEDFNETLTAFVNKTLDKQKMSFVVNINNDGLPLGGGVWYMEGYKTEASLAYLIAHRYNEYSDTGVIVRSSTYFNGSWKAWKGIG